MTIIIRVDFKPAVEDTPVYDYSTLYGYRDFIFFNRDATKDFEIIYSCNGKHLYSEVRNSKVRSEANRIDFIDDEVQTLSHSHVMSRDIVFKHDYNRYKNTLDFQFTLWLDYEDLSLRYKDLLRRS